MSSSHMDIDMFEPDELFFHDEKDYESQMTNTYDKNKMNNTSTNEENNNSNEHISMILCPLCKTPIEPNAVNLCMKCLNSQVDISDGISQQLVIFQCRQCERWYKNPQWIKADLESNQLLALCLKKIRGLSKVKVINAEFIWSEPHSKRMKVKLTIQKEVFNNAIVEKSFPVEFMMENQQCEDCQQSFTHHTWRACVQVRQKVDHKRTFLFLEQILLKHNMTSNCHGITEQKDGIDFFFGHRSHAQAFLAFLHGVVPIEAKQSRRLVSQDLKSNITKYKYTFNAEIANICRNDLVLFPPQFVNKLGGVSPLLLCHKVSQALYFIDPITLHTIELDTSQFFRINFTSLATSRHLSKLFVMNIRNANLKKGKYSLCEVECVRENEIGMENARILETYSHLGGIIKEGDIVLGYDFGSLLSVEEDLMNNAMFKKHSKKSKNS